MLPSSFFIDAKFVVGILLFQKSPDPEFAGLEGGVLHQFHCFFLHLSERDNTLL